MACTHIGSVEDSLSTGPRRRHFSGRVKECLLALGGSYKFPAYPWRPISPNTSTSERQQLTTSSIGERDSTAWRKATK